MKLYIKIFLGIILTTSHMLIICTNPLVQLDKDLSVINKKKYYISFNFITRQGPQNTGPWPASMTVRQLREQYPGGDLQKARARFILKNRAGDNTILYNHETLGSLGLSTSEPNIIQVFLKNFYNYNPSDPKIQAEFA